MNEKLKMFLSDVVKFNDLSPSCADILFVFASADTEVIEYNIELKSQLLQATRMWGNSLQNKLKELKNKGLIENPSKGHYRLNSAVFQAVKSIKQGVEVFISIRYIETESTITKQIAYVQDVQEEETVSATIETTTSTVNTNSHSRRTGRAGTPKPDNWAEIKAKILSGEITKKSVWQSLGISSNTLNKWLNEND